MSWEGWTRFRGPGSVDGVGEKREKGKRFLAGREDHEVPPGPPPPPGPGGGFPPHGIDVA
jgi:hypothetical protein